MQCSNEFFTNWCLPTPMEYYYTSTFDLLFPILGLFIEFFMGDSDEELEKKRRDRDKFKRERECSERADITDVKRRHSSLSSNIDDKLKSRAQISPTARSNKRFKRDSQDFQNFPFPWQPFEGELLN